MKKGFRLTLILILLVSLIAVAGCSSKPPVATEKVLKVGSDIAYAPFEFFDEKQQPAGFDIDLMKAIGEELGYKVVFETASFDGKI